MKPLCGAGCSSLTKKTAPGLVCAGHARPGAVKARDGRLRENSPETRRPIPEKVPPKRRRSQTSGDARPMGHANCSRGPVRSFCQRNDPLAFGPFIHSFSNGDPQ